MIDGAALDSCCMDNNPLMPITDDRFMRLRPHSPSELMLIRFTSSCYSSRDRHVQLSGNVLDLETSKPLEGVRLRTGILRADSVYDYLELTTHSRTVTDDDGYFSISDSLYGGLRLVVDSPHGHLVQTYSLGRLLIIK